MSLTSSNLQALKGFICLGILSPLHQQFLGESSYHAHHSLLHSLVETVEMSVRNESSEICYNQACCTLEDFL